MTLDVWHVPRQAVPAALARMALDRRHLRAAPGLSFAKSLGTGRGRTFTVRDADPRRWALLTVWRTLPAALAFRRSPLHRAWSRLAEESWQLDLRPLASRGRWSGRTPFGEPVPERHDGPVAAVTRARIRSARTRRFWGSVPPVSAALHRAPGLRVAFGIGEAPIGLQGTFSLWDSPAALTEFAYAGAAHADVVARTPTEGWYAEELFARFAVVGSAGTFEGRDPLS